jgi:hypothetical protein
MKTVSAASLLLSAAEIFNKLVKLTIIVRMLLLPALKRQYQDIFSLGFSSSNNPL